MFRSSSASENQLQRTPIPPKLPQNSPRTPEQSPLQSGLPGSPHVPNLPSSEAVSTTHGKWANMKICSLASGVKCLGATDLDAQTSVLSTESSSGSILPSSWTERDSLVIDMHAEILARRELECLLMREMRVLLKRERLERLTADQDAHGGVTNDVEGDHHRNSSIDESTAEQEREEEEANVEPFLLELVYPSWLPPSVPIANICHQPPESPTISARPFFRLKSSVKLYLYTSHAPCGAASDAAHLRRLDTEDEAIYRLLSQSDIMGSTAKEPIAHSRVSETESQSMSPFRLSKSLEVPPICKKPSRADAPPTTAFSCSDKLGRYQWLGFQGGRLSKMFESVEQIRSGSQNEQENHQSCNQQYYVGYPLRLCGLVTGEDYESTCLHKIFGNTVASDDDGFSYSRIRNGLQEVLAQQGESSGKCWLQGLIDNECKISEATLLFPFGRAAISNSSDKSALPRIPADADITKLRTLPIPLLRDILLPTSLSSSTPFSVALSYHAFSMPQALGPNGRLSGVIRDKRTKRWGDNSVARVARGRMSDAFEQLLKDYEACFDKLWGGDAASSKGGKGWNEAAQWMEERGPYAGWHSPQCRE